MAQFDDDFAAVDDMFADVFGTEDITVTEVDGTEHTYAAEVLDEKVESRETDLGTETVVAREVCIKSDPDGRESDGTPKILNLRGTVTIGDLVYAIENVTHSRSGDAVLHTKRISASEKSRRDYRRQSQ